MLCSGGSSRRGKVYSNSGVGYSQRGVRRGMVRGVELRERWRNTSSRILEISIAGSALQSMDVVVETSQSGRRHILLELPWVTARASRSPEPRTRLVFIVYHVHQV